MSFLFRRARRQRGRERKSEEGAEGGQKRRKKPVTSPIESHFGARLIYFFLLLVRMQMAAAAVPNFFQRPAASLSTFLASLQDVRSSHRSGSDGNPDALSFASVFLSFVSH